jgi:hypothetical protein
MARPEVQLAIVYDLRDPSGWRHASRLVPGRSVAKHRRREDPPLLGAARPVRAGGGLMPPVLTRRRTPRRRTPRRRTPRRRTRMAKKGLRVLVESHAGSLP